MKISSEDREIIREEWRPENKDSINRTLEIISSLIVSSKLSEKDKVETSMAAGIFLPASRGDVNRFFLSLRKIGIH
jgi:hypothetical protein